MDGNAVRGAGDRAAAIRAVNVGAGITQPVHNIRAWMAIPVVLPHRNDGIARMHAGKELRKVENKPGLSDEHGATDKIDILRHFTTGNSDQSPEGSVACGDFLSASCTPMVPSANIVSDALSVSGFKYACPVNNKLDTSGVEFDNSDSVAM